MDAKIRAQTDASVLKRTSSVRCCAPVQGSVIDKFESRHSMPAWIVQQCRCTNGSSHVLNSNGFTRKREAPAINLHFLTSKLLFLRFWSENIIVIYLKYVLFHSFISTTY